VNDISSAVAWQPTPDIIEAANITRWRRELGFDSYDDLHRWSCHHPAEFWSRVVERLGIRFHQPPTAAMRSTSNPLSPEWFPDARLSIVESCFQQDPEADAVIYRQDDSLHRMSAADLRSAVDQVAAGFDGSGFAPGDRIAICMPMTVEAVCAYLGIVKAGGVVVSIADSFAPEEIATRLRIGAAKATITQMTMERAGKTLPMFEKVKSASDLPAIVIGADASELRPQDTGWGQFLGDGPVEPAIRSALDATNILFSSGTTGEPKAIPWSQLTPIKAAMDGHFHQDIHPGDVVAWPTNLGWMMGPWLIYAALVNQAAIALYDDVPIGPGFGRFVQDAGVTMLGVVPSLVRAWRESGSMQEFDWGAIRAFSSTGEASNPDDMAWLMDLAGGKPMIEYCGGTEIGGGYITGTVVQPAVPAAFSTAALGQSLVILDEDGNPAEEGELYLATPSVGLSNTVLNRDHDEVYFAGTPTTPGGRPLRRHGDYMACLGNGYYRAMGRVDDTMNLGGIKVSSAEIERAFQGIEALVETAAIAVPPPGGGPARLVVYAVAPGADPAELEAAMTGAVREKLNPLFKIDEVVPVDSLPRTASNKVMRRRLRADYQKRESP
jgi:acetyl-CoA synthetase